MAKKKDSVALFEVITKSRQARSQAGLSVPGWMEKNRQRLSGEAPVPTIAAVPAVPRGVSTSGRLLSVSLSQTGWVATATCLIVLLGVVFWLGRITAPSQRQAPPQAALGTETQKPSVVGDSTATNQPTSTSRTPGLYYLVIQGTRGTDQKHKEDAWAIRDYLASQGMTSEVRLWTGANKQYVVWAYQGFDSPRSDQAKRYVDMIEELGRRYKTAGGQYGFEQRKDDPWFIKAQ